MSAAYALGSIGKVDERLKILRRICDERERFGRYVLDPEGEGSGIYAYELAFRALWHNAPSK